MSCCAEHQLVASSSTYLLGMWASSPYVTTLLLGPPLLALLLLYPALLFFTPQEKQLPSTAFQYRTAKRPSEKQLLPKLVNADPTDQQVQLSIVIPAFNEQERLPHMLKEAVQHLRMLQEQAKTLVDKEAGSLANGNGTVHRHNPVTQNALLRPLRSYEIIIVDDGSRDATAEVALQFAKTNELDDVIRVIQLGRNCGKGKAVRHGVLHARGALIAFCDADGATRFADLSTLAKELERIVTPAGHGIVCGSRAHLVGSEAVIKVRDGVRSSVLGRVMLTLSSQRSFVRNFLMHSFHFILSLLMRPPNPIAFIQARLPALSTRPASRQSLPVQPPIHDTQCGFKLFTRQSAQAIFPLAHIDRWIFDVELLLLAEKASYTTLRQTAAAMLSTQDDHSADPLLRLPLPISEVAVDWREVEGSKIDILKDSIQMGLDLLVIRLNYALGRWKSPAVLPGAMSVCKGKEDECCR